MTLSSFWDWLWNRWKPPIPPPTPPPIPSLAKLRGDLLTAMNQERGRKGVRALQEEARLDGAVQGHADWMAAHQSVTHDEGKDQLKERLRRGGYSAGYAGEIIAGGQVTVAEVMFSWMTSTKGHREEILNGDFRDVGMGIAIHQGVFYWCVDFASPL